MIRPNESKLATGLYANGVLADTGNLLPEPQEGAYRRIAHDVAEAGLSIAELSSIRPSIRPKLLGTISEVQPHELAQTGWGIVFPAEMESQAVEEALSPLIEHRRAQASRQRSDLFKIFSGSSGWQPGETASAWLSRQGSGPRLEVVNPRAGVPYYLLIVGSPEMIPMSFQYTLDIFWAVGRLHFSTIEEYARYAKSVVDYENAINPLQSKQLVLFAPEHAFDESTRIFTNKVVHPFVYGDSQQDPLGKNQGFQLNLLIGSEATKEGLTALLGGRAPTKSAAILFSGSHGMAFRLDDKRQSACQGALVCQDWQGLGSISESEWFSAADLPSDARIHGMIHFLFACYGGGWEEFDTYRTGSDGSLRRNAPTSSIARLPQAMLGHPRGGALAVIAHIDRVWSYSFENDRGASQSTGIRDVLTGVMMGWRIGQATDQFNVRWLALDAELHGFENSNIAGRGLMRRWIMRDDARNYVILGDPAVKLRI